MTSHYDITTGAGRRTVPATDPTDPTYLRRAGLLCAAGGLIAVVGTCWGFFQAVPGADAVISAPQSVTTFRLLELVWTLTHVLTFFGALGLARSGLAGTTRAGRTGTRLAVVGMAALVPCELAFIPFASSTDSDTGPMVASTVIGIASMIAGVGFVVAGISTLRAGRWVGPARLLPLLTGAWVFLVMTPLIIADGRLFYVGIGSWNLVLALLGFALYRLGEKDVPLRHG
ncbi:MAG: hypothetical protein ACJ72D_23090 [Marmoricola sp.]